MNFAQRGGRLSSPDAFKRLNNIYERPLIMLHNVGIMLECSQSLLVPPCKPLNLVSVLTVGRTTQKNSQEKPNRIDCFNTWGGRIATVKKATICSLLVNCRKPISNNFTINLIL